MAAISSKGACSNIKTLRITYHELVELAEALDKSLFKENSFNDKSRGDIETRATDLSPIENLAVTVTKEGNCLDPNTCAKNVSAVKKSHPKKHFERKSHKERNKLGNDGAPPKRMSENETLECQNKDFETKLKLTELSDDENSDLQKANVKKKHRKRGLKHKEKSIEGSVDAEESSDKLNLHDNEKGKTKSKHKEKSKRQLESKSKDLKKTKSNREEGQNKERLHFTQDAINEEDGNLEVNHQHGILKLPNSKSNHSHSHVSFSEESDSHGTNYKIYEERGILHIPQGVNICEGEFTVVKCADERLIIDSHHDDVANLIPTQNMQSDFSLIRSSEQESFKLNSSEKRLRSLNRQRAQHLVKQAQHSETSLSNLLSKGVTDQGTLNRVFSLSKEIQNLYKGVIMLDLTFTHQQDIDQHLWKNGFYQVIETFRKYGKLFLGYSNQRDTISQEQINRELSDFLQAAGNFYTSLLDVLQKTYHFDVQDIVSQPRKAEFLARNAKLALLTCHHTLIFLGDIQRYKEQLHPSSNSNWSGVRRWYLQASKLAPKNGKPYNQLAVIAVYANHKLDAVFYYVRSLCVNCPILTAKEKLTTIFYEIQKKADQLRKKKEKEEENAKHEEQLRRKHNAEPHRHVFEEAARGVRLVGRTSSERLEIWVFIRQGVCRRLVLNESGCIQQLDAMGKYVNGELQKEHGKHKQAKQESPKISLQEVNKKFMLHFLCAHGSLYTRIGIDRLPDLQVELIGELHILLKYPQCSSVGFYSLLQMAAINMYAIEHTSPSEEIKEPFVRKGTPQDQALNLSIDVLITLMNACTDILLTSDHGNRLSDTLRQYLPTIKVWFDWLICHQEFWQTSMISVHRILWEAVSHLANAVLQIDLPCFEMDENDEVLVTLAEDEFLAGFKPLANADHAAITVKISQDMDLVQDHLHVTSITKFAMQMSSKTNPTLQYCEESGQFSSAIPSLPSSPENTQLYVDFHMDLEDAGNQDAYKSDEVILEGVLESIDSGDEADKGFKELKAKKDQLARQLEDQEEKHSKAKAVVHENISRAHLIFENYPNYLVPDTNCFIDHPNGIQAITTSNDFTLIVPIVVINELDGLKKDCQFNKYRDHNHARMVMNNSKAAIDFLEDQFSQRSPYVKALTSKGTVMDTIAFRSEDTSSRKGNNDDVILSCCLHFCEENVVNKHATADQPITIRRNVVLLTDDRNLRVKAYTRNVPVLTVPQFLQMARL